MRVTYQFLGEIPAGAIILWETCCFAKIATGRDTSLRTERLVMPHDLVCWSIDIYSTGLFSHYYPHLIHAQSLKLKLSSRSLLQQSQLSTKLKTIDIRAISEKRNRLGLAWFDMIIIEQCYLFRRGFTKEIAKIKLIQRDLKQADVISFRMEGRTQKQG